MISLQLMDCSLSESYEVTLSDFEGIVPSTRREMELSPQHVVSTFSRQLCAQPDLIPFIHSIRYEEEENGVESEEQENAAAVVSSAIIVQRIRVRFWSSSNADHNAAHQLQYCDLEVKRTAAAGAGAFVCQRIYCSLASLQPTLHSLLLSSFVGSRSSLLFPLVESVLRVLRDHSRPAGPIHSALQPSSYQDANLCARRIAATLRRQQSSSSSSTTTEMLLSKAMALEVYLCLLASAAHSARSCALVHPLPSSCRTLVAVSNDAAALSNESSVEQDAALVRLQTALLQLPPLLPLCVRTAVATDDEAAERVLQSSVSVSALSLLSYGARMHELMDLRCTELHSASDSSDATSAAAVVRRNWYKFDNDHHSNLSCPPPHWVIDVTVHDPHFDELVRSGSSGASASSSSSSGQLLEVFHGSPLCNWYSIFHRGLQNLSGTKLMTSGALFGSGVYFSDDLRVARNFAKAGYNPLHTQSASMLGERLECVGVYELWIPPLSATAASASSLPPAPVRRAPPAELAAKDVDADAVPDNYFVVSDPRYVRLKQLIVWRADGENIGSSRSAANSITMKMQQNSSQYNSAGAGLPQINPTAVHSAAPPLPLMDRLFHSLRSLFSGSGLIVAYACVLLALALAQMDLERTRNIAMHWWRAKAASKWF